MTISIALFGVGLVGTEFLRFTRDDSRIQIALLATSTKHGFLKDDDRLNIDQFLSSKQNNNGKWQDTVSIEEIIAKFKALNQNLKCLVDCTASSDLPNHYGQFLKNGIHIVAANKKGFSGSSDLYKELISLQDSCGVKIFWESTVGAGLPIVQLVRDMHLAKEPISTIEGVLSGTLSYIWNSLSSAQDQTFSQVVEDARGKGYTEPDPRDDLCGMDVARKIVILARAAGMQDIELKDVELESLVPLKLQGLKDKAEFLEQLPEYDKYMTEKIERARNSKKVLRYVGMLDIKQKACTVKLQSYDLSHPFAGLSGSENIIKVCSDRSWPDGIVIRGAGAGAAATAYGVVSDETDFGVSLYFSALYCVTSLWSISATTKLFPCSAEHSMKAIYFEKYGSPDVLQLKELETPVPKKDEVLIRIHAASVNAADWHLMRADPFVARLAFGLFKPKHNILGLDVAGRIEAVGNNAKKFQIGDEVFGDIVSRGCGAFAEYVCVPEKLLVLKPSNISFEEAAALPLAGATALQSLRMGKVEAGHKVLINGASGGVGTFAVQIAKALGADVTAVCSTGNVDMVRSIGADNVIDYKQEDFTKGEQRYDMILAANGHHWIMDYRRALNPGGHYVTSGGPTSQLSQAVFLGPLLSLFGGKKMSNILAKTTTEDLVFIKELVETGKLKPVIDRRYTLSEVPEAIRYLEEGHAKGKVVISIVS